MRQNTTVCMLLLSVLNCLPAQHLSAQHLHTTNAHTHRVRRCWSSNSRWSPACAAPPPHWSPPPPRPRPPPPRLRCRWRWRGRRRRAHRCPRWVPLWKEEGREDCGLGGCVHNSVHAAVPVKPASSIPRHSLRPPPSSEGHGTPFHHPPPSFNTTAASNPTPQSPPAPLHRRLLLTTHMSTTPHPHPTPTFAVP